jgi:hypothetical protein
VARTARQFYQHAQFHPEEPKTTRGHYEQLIRKILARSPRDPGEPDRRIVIPGYNDLRQFSAEFEHVIKAEAGSAWQSFLQRGNWRMILPFSRRHQARTAERLQAAVRADRPPLVHLVCFPSLTLNHAILIFDARAGADGIEFRAYDPNRMDAPARLIFDRHTQRFSFDANHYFAGGPVNVYEVYRGVFY